MGFGGRSEVWGVGAGQKYRVWGQVRSMRCGDRSEVWGVGVDEKYGVWG